MHKRFIPLVSYIVMFGSAFDAYSIAKKIKSKTIPILCKINNLVPVKL